MKPKTRKKGTLVIQGLLGHLEIIAYYIISLYHTIAYYIILLYHTIAYYIILLYHTVLYYYLIAIA